MKKLYYTYSDEYESEAFYDENENMITMWSCNDAHWRSEYMNPLLEFLGYRLEYRRDLSDLLTKHCEELWG